jgi:hypothetical protein
MLNEHIKNEIAVQVGKQFEDVKKSLEIFSLPLISEYKILVWAGQANGILIPRFNLQHIVGRYIIIKGFEIVPYYFADGIDLAFSDGTTETIPANIRVQRCLDVYTPATANTNFRIDINGTPLSLFQTNVATGNIPPDFKVDNIYFKFSEKVQNMAVFYSTEILTIMVAPYTPQNPNVKVFIECYLI